MKTLPRRSGIAIEQKWTRRLAGAVVFAADIKRDLCGLGAVGAPQGKIAERIASMPWLNHQPQAYPVTLWDVYGVSGHPLRTTLTEMGPLLLVACSN